MRMRVSVAALLSVCTALTVWYALQSNALNWSVWAWRCADARQRFQVIENPYVGVMDLNVAWRPRLISTWSADVVMGDTIEKRSPTECSIKGSRAMTRVAIYCGVTMLILLIGMGSLGAAAAFGAVFIAVLAVQKAIQPWDLPGILMWVAFTRLWVARKPAWFLAVLPLACWIKQTIALVVPLYFLIEGSWWQRVRSVALASILAGAGLLSARWVAQVEASSVANATLAASNLSWVATHWQAWVGGWLIWLLRPKDDPRLWLAVALFVVAMVAGGIVSEARAWLELVGLLLVVRFTGRSEVAPAASSHPEQPSTTAC